MYDAKSLSALLVLLLAAGPASVVSVPVAADQNIVARQINSESEAGSNWDFSIPGGPSYKSDSYASSDYHEGPSQNGGSSLSSGSDASDGTTISIPGGPSFKSGSFAHDSYEQTEPEPEPKPEPEPEPEPTPTPTPQEPQ
ncbi:hypothetical protein ANOM_001840, partial [Aspergillus nomiae NRRL 13137]